MIDKLREGSGRSLQIFSTQKRTIGTALLLLVVDRLFVVFPLRDTTGGTKILLTHRETAPAHAHAHALLRAAGHHLLAPNAQGSLNCLLFYAKFSQQFYYRGGW